jgi:hypothetical protein
MKNVSWFCIGFRIDVLFGIKQRLIKVELFIDIISCLVECYREPFDCEEVSFFYRFLYSDYEEESFRIFSQPSLCRLQNFDPKFTNGNDLDEFEVVE